ncbi:MAG TPA: GDSL-type esterase/lipase family protein [Bryobacteraceae bacterium]
MNKLFSAGFALITGIGIVLLSSGNLPGAAAKTRTKKKTVSPPPISHAARDAAARRVEGYLQASAGMGFDQPQMMGPFFQRLTQLLSGESAAPVHILHFGDSHTAADEWTGGMRYYFQHKFGNGGSGYSLAGHPFLGYRRFGTRHGATASWQTEGLSSGMGDGYFGLGGVSIFTKRAGQSVFIEAECSDVGIYYLQMPGGGDVELIDNDQIVKTFSTDGDIAATMVNYRTTPGMHTLKLLTLQNRPVRLLGWATDRDSGVTYEALGINGAQASIFFRWNENMIADDLKLRNPALIVLAYGSNEASDPNWTEEGYQAMFTTLLKRLKTDCPNASILVLGPTDRMMRMRTGSVVLVQGIEKIVNAQRLACAQMGATYWNAKERMGGSTSIRDWALAGLGQNDYVHFTAPGYDKLAEVLFGDIMRLYDQYLKVHSTPPTQISDGQASQSN